ncbi:uncharacterized protein BDV17DRAFT_112138 [Aspergillus undulatus]|uniref:uncharacterized protein n=1 Tax=Aspergillus undulatus TaxID=1810928 RepID=UPI003CCDDBEB
MKYRCEISISMLSKPRIGNQSNPQILGGDTNSVGRTNPIQKAVHISLDFKPLRYFRYFNDNPVFHEIGYSKTSLVSRLKVRPALIWVLRICIRGSGELKNQSAPSGSRNDVTVLDHLGQKGLLCPDYQKIKKQTRTFGINSQVSRRRGLWPWISIPSLLQRLYPPKPKQLVERLLFNCQISFPTLYDKSSLVPEPHLRAYLPTLDCNGSVMILQSDL